MREIIVTRRGSKQATVRLNRNGFSFDTEEVNLMGLLGRAKLNGIHVLGGVQTMDGQAFVDSEYVEHPNENRFGVLVSEISRMGFSVEISNMIENNP